MITLVTMGQGNPIALKRTLDSFKPHCNEVIFGDLCVFPEDSKLIRSYWKDYNMQIVQYPFNTIFKSGFSAILNNLASYATNDYVLYMNVSEVIDENGPQPSLDILGLASSDCYFFTHATDPHHWYRLYNRKMAAWGGLIHEELLSLDAQLNFSISPSFQMADTEKDIDNSFKAKVYNDIKELTYFNQYLRLVDEPASIGPTNQGWVDYAKDGYNHIKERMLKKGDRYKAFVEGDLELYLKDIKENPEFEKERMESSDLINFQGDRKLL